MNPISIPKPVAEPSGVMLNALLLEAEYLQVVSSIRALFKSNEELSEALKEDPQDSDFLEAVRENVAIMLKKRHKLIQIVTDARRQGAMLDIPIDIQEMSVEAWVANPIYAKEEVEEKSDEQQGGGFYL